MDFKTAREIIRKNIDCRNNLEKSKGSLYCCPFCGSGHGEHKSGALKVGPDGTFHCFACNKNGDAIDLYMNATGKEFKEAVRDLAQQAGIHENISFGRNGTPEFSPLPAQRNQAPQSGSGASGTAQAIPFDGRKEAAGHSGTPDNAAAPAADYSAYYARCQESLAASEAAQAYLAGRGIDWMTAHAHGVGFDPAADPVLAPGGVGYVLHPCPRIIIPTSNSHYVGRSIDPKTDDHYVKLNNKGGKSGIFCADQLTEGFDTVFVCEGAMDALSVFEAGKAAIALNSVTNVNTLLRLLEEKPTESTLVLCLDNDGRGKEAAEKLAAGLDRLNVAYLIADISGEYKDPNEAIQNDRAGFISRVKRAASLATETRLDNTSDYVDRMMAGEIRNFQRGKNRKTGFSNLDDKMRGAYAGLYVLAAISSLGKTTLALQMADQMAAAGNDVLFFSMEQSRLELVCKSLARLSAMRDMKTAVTSLDIREGERLPEYLGDVVRKYKETMGDRLSIIEGDFNCDIGFIRSYVQNYMQKTKTSPIVFIDYLQIIQPSNEGKSRNSKKDDIDLAVTQLKRMSKSMGLTIIVISSVNRANYQTPFSYESLKESGGIEYTADVVWGLQLSCLDSELFEKDGNVVAKRETIKKAKKESPRKIKFVCLKNRYGESSYETYFKYYPAYDLFIPAPELEDEYNKKKINRR